MPALLTEKIHLSFIEEGGGGGGELRVHLSSIIYLVRVGGGGGGDSELL